jgi:hypothetical protein
MKGMNKNAYVKRKNKIDTADALIHHEKEPTFYDT